MKKIFILAIAAFMSVTIQAQQKEIVSKEFWQQNPNLETVKSALNRFDFKEIQGSEDPVFLALNNNASFETIKFLIDQPGVNLSRTIHEGRIMLHQAVTVGNVEVTDYLLTKGSNMHFIDANGHTPLSFAAFAGKLRPEIVDVFLKHGLDIHKKYEKKDNANLLLLGVCYDKNLELTDYFISKGLDINATDDNGKGAFFYASKIGDVSILKELVKRGVAYKNDAFIAAAQGTYKSATSIDTYQYLIEELKLDPKNVEEKGQTLLHLVTKKQNQEEVVPYLIAKGVNASKVDKENNTAFMNASAGKSVNVVKALLPYVKDINAVNATGETALLKAVKTASGEIVEFLVANGANVNVTDENGNNLAYVLVDSYRTPRFARGGNESANKKDDFLTKLEVLRSKGIDFSKEFKNKNTVYHLAADKNDLNLLKKLATVTVDLNTQNNEGMTALHKAALVAKDDAVLKYLLSLGAKKEVETEFGETAYDLAKENEFLAKNNVSVEFLKG